MSLRYPSSTVFIYMRYRDGARGIKKGPNWLRTPHCLFYYVVTNTILVTGTSSSPVSPLLKAVSSPTSRLCSCPRRARRRPKQSSPASRQRKRSFWGPNHCQTLIWTLLFLQHALLSTDRYVEEGTYNDVISWEEESSDCKRPREEADFQDGKWCLPYWKILLSDVTPTSSSTIRTPSQTNDSKRGCKA